MVHKKEKKSTQENPLLNLGINILIPAILMIKGVKWFGFSPTTALATALVFPFIYGLYDLIFKKKYNFASILGFVSVLLTGSIGLLKLSKEWIAVKEAAVPLVIGIAVLITNKTQFSLLRKLLFNDTIMNLDKIERRLDEKGTRKGFNKLINQSTWLIAGSFLLSSVLNFALAKIIVHSETGTQAFTEELGHMTAISFPVIALPCTIIMFFALWKLFSGIKKLTGLEIEELIKHPSLKEAK